MKIYTVVAAYRSPPCSQLLRWLKTNNVEWEVGSQEYGIDIARNQNANRFMLEAVPHGYTHLLMIDGDTIPAGREILDDDRDLIWLGYVGHQGTQGHVATFGCGASRISAKVFNSVPRPWFATRYNDEMTRRLTCECAAFEAKVKSSSGWWPVCVGQAGHQQGGDTGPILWPDGRMTWPAFS